ncbi:GGDEF domain-containing protein [Polymorphobacter fuscus]|uniref:diguanylate cyclase n=1 Tax=Sandarakinorhabdus fusca TaxID=1439888 RepID=A0A7C9GSA6_9SPHN|nr:GGDEF domain-containing protein [Polymorphobacter fuscus]KAB7646507.1 diguanylate cyclase [Polymorphobacter fuscus]MQT17751.1 diguanylate cyclase [Polymorphobacter fuscus]NJC09701.1 diguanylate cyclase [Polymorphobacter fuscus]
MTFLDSSMAIPAVGIAVPDPGPMRFFSEIGTLLLAHRLPPVPDVYDLLWRYVRDDYHALSLGVDRAIADGIFDLAAVSELRRAHCGDLDASAVTALVEAAHDQAEALSQRIESGRTDLADYGRAIADGGARLETPIDAAGLAVLLEQLGAATATIQAANARLEGELASAAVEMRGLAERLGAAERAAITDPLTGALNRRGTIETLERLQAETRAAGTRLALAMVDIDHFKRVNDRFGHALGDDVLRFVARHLADSIAAGGGKVGRFGGEEFVAMLPGHDVMRATAIIDKARSQLASQIIRNAVDGSSLGRVSFSAGVAGDRVEDSCETLIARADDALYCAKRMGRDRVVPDR